MIEVEERVDKAMGSLQNERRGSASKVARARTHDIVVSARDRWAIADPLCASLQTPPLALAGRTEVMTVVDKADKVEEFDGIDVDRHLARHGLGVKINRIIREKIERSDSPYPMPRIPARN